MDIKGAVTVKTLNKEHSLIKSSNEAAGAECDKVHVSLPH